MRSSTMHHSIIKLDSVRDLKSKVQALYGEESTIDLEFREYYDIIKIMRF